jgi:hypothetical protein
MDCTPEFQSLMIHKDRCKYPRVVFVISKEGLEGKRNKTILPVVFETPAVIHNTRKNGGRWEPL